MKNILFSFLFLSLSAYGQWIELDTGIEASYFSDVYAISTDVAVVVGANGIIIKTTDGGETWEQKDSGTTANLIKVQFATPNMGYIIGGNGTLLKTIDGGEAWLSLETGVSNNFGGLSVVSEDLLFIAYNEHLLKSEDGGNNWQNIIYEDMYIDDIFGSRIQFFDDMLGFVPKQNGSTLKTIDSGNTWQDLQAQAPAYFTTESVGFYYYVALLKTTNGGNSFNYVSDVNGQEGSVSYLYAIDESTIWIILDRLLDGDGSTRGVLKISPSDTETYTEQIWYDNDDNIDMWAVHFANETTGYIVGYSETGATIWKNSTGINEGELNVNEVDASISIKVYPNPTSSELNIDLSGISGNNVVVSLIDVTGKQVFSKSFMQKQIKINTRQFVKGPYILQVKTNDENYTQKVIIN